MKTCDNVVGRRVNKIDGYKGSAKRQFHKVCRRRARAMVKGAKK